MMNLQDLEVFLTGKKNTSKCLPGLADSAVPSFEPAAKRLRTEDGAVAGDERHLCEECAVRANTVHGSASRPAHRPYIECWEAWVALQPAPHLRLVEDLREI